MLPTEPALPYCRALMDELENRKTINLGNLENKTDKLSTDYLWGEARGKMFGVLVAEDKMAKQHILKAFSGQYNGIWDVPGWVGPLFDIKQFHLIQDEREREIKQLSHQIETSRKQSDTWRALRTKRRQLSRNLMQDIFDLYHLHNFKGTNLPLTTVFNSDKLPTGTGDCCAPKLLHHAALQGLRPVAMAEFYWGKENKSKTRVHGRFYPPCTDKCMPLLGFLLCGI